MPEIPESWLDALEAAVAHRGPDGAGRWRDEVVRADGRKARVGLVHRRLAVIDLAGGRQPMVLDEGPAGLRAVVFNGCIYNHRQLRWNLASGGAKFATDHSDTEVLLHGHKAWGAGLAGHLEGMFAFGLWAREDGTLTLGRDLAGEKPLCFASAEGEGRRLVVFGSSPVGVANVMRMASPVVLGRAFEVRAARLEVWLRFGAGGVAAFEGVADVAPGETLVFGGGSPTAAPTSHARPVLEGAALTREDVGEVISRGVESRLEADVPIGCMLSGGIDSGLVAACAQRALARQGRKLRTFTVKMPDAGLDESAAAAATAAHLGTEHTTLPCEANAAEDLVRLVRELGTPLGDSSVLPTYWLCRAMRRHVTVALSGDGGDELFAGYQRHVAARWMRRLGPLARLVGLMRVRPTSWRNDKLARLASAGWWRDYAELRSMFTRGQLRRLAPGLALGRGAGWPARPWDEDFATYLPWDLMRKSDGASMSVALEVRSPLLDSTLVRRAQATAWGTLTDGGRPKGMLRRLAGEWLAPGAAGRPKRGFAVPIGEWFRSDYGGLRGLLVDATGAAEAYPAEFLGVEMQRSEIVRMRDAHLSGREEHGQRLFGLLVLALWVRECRGL